MSYLDFYDSAAFLLRMGVNLSGSRKMDCKPSIEAALFWCDYRC